MKQVSLIKVMVMMATSHPEYDRDSECQKYTVCRLNIFDHNECGVLLIPASTECLFEAKQQTLFQNSTG